jgi:hypothetical protein
MKAYDNDNLVPLTGLPDDKNTVAHLTQVTEDKKTHISLRQMRTTTMFLTSPN